MTIFCQFKNVNLIYFSKMQLFLFVSNFDFELVFFHFLSIEVVKKFWKKKFETPSEETFWRFRSNYFFVKKFFFLDKNEMALKLETWKAEMKEKTILWFRYFFQVLRVPFKFFSNRCLSRKACFAVKKFFFLWMPVVLLLWELKAVRGVRCQRAPWEPSVE